MYLCTRWSLLILNAILCNLWNAALLIISWRLLYPRILVWLNWISLVVVLSFWFISYWVRNSFNLFSLNLNRFFSFYVIITVRDFTDISFPLWYKLNDLPRIIRIKENGVELRRRKEEEESCMDFIKTNSPVTLFLKSSPIWHATRPN